MLRGAPVEAGAGPDHLADLLAAAAAPARDGELDGEEAAVAAFRVAPLAPVTQPRREPMSKLLLAKLLTVKVAATALGAVAVGGVAVAASTGGLPLTGGRGDAAVSSTATPSVEVTAPSLPTPSAGAHVSAQLFGLCHAYTAAADAGAALASPGMSALVTAAGGRDQVGGFCAKVLAAQAGATVTPGLAGGADGGTAGAGVDASAGPAGVGKRGLGLGVGASAGPGGAGLGVGVGSGAGVGTHAGPTGAGLSGQVPGAGVAATASPGGLGSGVATSTASPGAAGLSVAVSAGASPPAHR
jgi:hypothetical protein